MILIGFIFLHDIKTLNDERKLKSRIVITSIRDESKSKCSIFSALIGPVLSIIARFSIRRSLSNGIEIKNPPMDIIDINTAITKRL